MASSLQIIVGPASHLRTFAQGDLIVGDVIKDAMRQDQPEVEAAMIETGMSTRHPDTGALVPPLDFGDDGQVAEAFTAWVRRRTVWLARIWRRQLAEQAVVITEPDL